MEGLDGACSLLLSYRSQDGEEGYPGTVDVAVTYTLTAENVFVIETEAITDRPTPLNLTHHSYFNLAGEGSGSISDHELQIDADQYIPTDEHMTLLGRYASVNGQGNDLRKGQRLGDAIPQLFRNHGDLYRIRRPSTDHGREHVAAACLVDPASGRSLHVSTTESHLQLYTSSALDGSLIGKSGAPYAKHAAVCLECHGYPDGANATSSCDNILRPGQTHRHTTMYAFSTVDVDRPSDAQIESLQSEAHSAAGATASVTTSHTHSGLQV
jgi:aldose 1-epimerase